MSSPSIAELREASARLVATGSSFGEKLAAAEALHAGLLSLAAPEPGDRAWIDGLAADDHLALDHGLAVGPTVAARCVVDFVRTMMFARGVGAAMADAAGRFPGRTLHVLYAGCGPIAPLFVIPMLERSRDAAAAEFTLLDIHPTSLAAARRVVERLGLGAQVRDYVLGDATRYRASAPVHVLIIETLRAALDHEPQVAITGNLAPQLEPGGILVPARITVDACLLDPAKEHSLAPAGSTTIPETVRDRSMLGRLIEVSQRTADDLLPFRLPSTTVTIPALEDDRYTLALLTRIETYAAHVLDGYASGLTLPKRLGNMQAASTPARVELTYETGPHPRFVHRILGGSER